MPYSILRRYTPPTCTLEIMAKNSPLSRWAGQLVVKQLRFQLTLDDPKLPQEQWLTLRGDRAQLEALHEAVSTYVQAFLEQSQSHFKTNGVSASDATIATLAVATPHTARSTGLPSGAKQISLHPKGLLTHNLVLGTLAIPEKPSVLPLSALQLFDLANALDDYASELVALPLQRSRQSALSSLRWGQLAATGLVVIGLSASVAKIIDSSRKPASPPVSQGASSDQLATQPPAVVSPLPSIASGQPLPPPPPIGSTVPGSPGLPTFPLSSFSTGSPKANNSPVGAIPKPDLNRPEALRQDAGGQIAILPRTTAPTITTRSQPTKPMPSLSLNREFASAPLNQTRSAESRSSARSSNQADQTDTAFDTISQIAEARQYFQQRWNPPQGLTQT
ncbi:MAG: DUF4335 domain-containing protein, partial [Verrucomicrobia bacterium]|nr:DUF4335 domain-containing protein [Leptolyngbya sp. ES-bin-22]